MVDGELGHVLRTIEEAAGQRMDPPSSFARRLRIQKTVYILQALGHPVANKYHFGAYFHGPYSPRLTRVYYGKAEPPARAGQISEKREDRIIAAVAEAVGKGNEFLEAAATLHLVVQNRGLGKASAFEQVKWLKPHAAEHLEEAWEFLRNQDLVGART